MEDLTGRQLGPYRVVASLGEGGMAAVYKAYQPGMDRYVALKILPRHFASDPTFMGRFQQEARIIAKLQHPHILPVFDFGEADGYTYLVMPFVTGGTLTELLTGQPLPLKQIRTIVSQLGDALDYAHAHGLVHRDVKPSNVLLDERGNCLLSDFGIAKIIEGTSRFTTTGGLIGTPAYMSPEQGAGEKIDRRSDIYSLGVMLYEMATGRAPFAAETPVAVVIKHIHDPLPPPRMHNPALPEALERTILKALAKRPDDRFASAAEFVQALQAAIPETGAIESVSAVPTQVVSAVPTQEPLRSPAVPRVPTRIAEPSTPRRRAPGWMWLAGGLALIALLIGAFALINRPAESGGAIALATNIVAPQPTVPPLPTSTSTPPSTPTPAPTPPGGGTGWIVFTSQVDGKGDIFVIQSDGSELKNLTNHPAEDAIPAWSPDGTRIVFRSDRDGNNEIYVMNADGSGLTNLTNNPAYDDRPVWSPDGSRLAFYSDRGRNFDVYVMNVDGSNPVNLTNNPATDFDPAWSPDGTRIAFTSERDGNREIYVMNTDGFSSLNVTNNPAADKVPAWLPDSSRIVFETDRDGNREIYVMNVDGSGLINLTNNPASDRWPVWSPDGLRIAFDSDRDGNRDIYVMNADGSAQTRVTNAETLDFAPSWQPARAISLLPTVVAQPTLASAVKKIAVVLDTAGENDKSFNEYTLKGAREAAERLGSGLSYVVPQSSSDYEKNIETFAAEGADLIIAAGWIMGDAIEKVAQRYPTIQFVIVDFAYDEPKYQNTLKNVTSLMFAEDEAAYPAGVLAACMSKSGVVATVSGIEIPPVVRYVTGFQNGAKSVNSSIKTLNLYIPDFNDPATGKQAAQDFIAQKADVIFGVGGNTGNGGLLAAKDAGVMAIGVDADLYYTFPEVRSALITSAMKKLDVATAAVVEAFARGELKAGVRMANAANGGVGLAPYHEWDSRIPQACKDKVNAAIEGLRNGTIQTGYRP